MAEKFITKRVVSQMVSKSGAPTRIVECSDVPAVEDMIRGIEYVVSIRTHHFGPDRPGRAQTRIYRRYGSKRYFTILEEG